ncbi:unnamed protein product [Nesidiocoris tenuis]|uniref:Uncharacterized protein n=1 Tax=Nesidiocoris tenuis TaxID=355587 RepID=A0A6H5GPU2_9HEMI|nr:unnamed protein product [Nesidiocoris tenuis]
MFVAYHVCGISCLWQICKLCRNQLQHRVWSSLCVLYSIQRWPWSQPTKARITRQTDLLPIPRTDTQTLFSDWLILWICSLWSTCITLQPFRIFAVSVRLFFEPPVLDCGPKTDSALDRSATPGPQLSKTICILINNMRKAQCKYKRILSGANQSLPITDGIRIFTEGEESLRDCSQVPSLSVELAIEQKLKLIIEIEVKLTMKQRHKHLIEIEVELAMEQELKLIIGIEVELTMNQILKLIIGIEVELIIELEVKLTMKKKLKIIIEIEVKLTIEQKLKLIIEIEDEQKLKLMIEIEVE